MASNGTLSVVLTEDESKKNELLTSELSLLKRKLEDSEANCRMMLAVILVFILMRYMGI